MDENEVCVYVCVYNVPSVYFCVCMCHTSAAQVSVA